MEILKQVVVLLLVLAPSLDAISLELPGAVNSAERETKLTNDLVMLYFWATWCPECKKSLKGKLARVPGERLQVVAVNTDGDAEKVASYLSREDVVVPSVLDMDKKLRKEFQVFSVPTAVLFKKVNGSYVRTNTFVGSDISKVSIEVPGVDL